MPAIIRNNDKSQRIVDSLARLLGVGTHASACTAVTFVEDKLLIVFNTPRRRSMKANQLVESVSNKLTLLRKFLNEFKENEAKEMAVNYAEKLFEFHRLGATIEKDNLQNRKKYFTEEERIQMDLLKLASFYRKSSSFNLETGFKQEHLNALMNEEPMIRYPDRTIESSFKAKIHADQLIVSIAKQHYQEKNRQDFKLIIGLNQLSCQVCASFFEGKENISHRGNSNLLYAKVLNLDNNEISNSCDKSPYLSKVASDSSSDDEFGVNKQIEDEKTKRDGYESDIESDIVFDTKINHQKCNKKIKPDSDFNSTSEDRNLDSEYLTESKNNIVCEKVSNEHLLNTKCGVFGFFNKLYKSAFEQEENSMTVFGKMRFLG